MKRHNLVLILGLVVLLAVGAALWRLSARPPAPSPIEAKRGDEHGDEHAGGRKSMEVELTPQQVEQAGIETVPAPRRASREILEVGGVIQADPARTARLTARAPGRVTSLSVSVGSRVDAGDILAIVDSPEVAERRAAVRAARARLELARRRVERQRGLAASRTENTGPVLEARLRRDRARTELERARLALRRAESLSPEVVSRRDLEAAKAEHRNALAELATAEEMYARERSVAGTQVRVRTDVEQVQADVEAASADLEAARDMLDALGVGNGAGGTYAAAVPLAGTVTTRTATVGQWVDAGDELFTVTDLSRVWAVIDIYEKDFQRVQVGQPVEIVSQAWPGRVFPGRLSYIHPVLEEKARTARGRVEIDNRVGLLRAEMYVQARVALRQRIQAVAVPHAAVVADSQHSYVYVREKGGHFIRRRVWLGPAEGEWYEVRSGLKAGEQVVVKGAFFLKSEQQKEEIGEGHAH